MPGQYANEPMLDMFIFETSQLIEQLEHSILSSEKSSCYSQTAVNEIFRIMHTIKGSSAMMMYNNISTLAHSIEDLFYFIREKNPKDIDCSALSDLVLEGVDFIKTEVEQIKNGDNADGDETVLISRIKGFLNVLMQNNSSDASNGIKPAEIAEHGDNLSMYETEDAALYNIFKAVICFEEGCMMENMRAFSVIHELSEITGEVRHIPEDIDGDDSSEAIRKDGFVIYLKTDCSYEEIYKVLMQTVFLKSLELIRLEGDDNFPQFSKEKQIAEPQNTVKAPDIAAASKEGKENSDREIQTTSLQKSIISVNVFKLDKLMDLVGEMVIAEAMVIQNPDLKGLELENFQKAARQLNKITSEIQDMVMSIRMVPLSATFHKMHRVVRDMNRKLGKEVELKISGEETEVDKNIIEHISDPLMHLVRNAIDHGIEQYEEREAKGKKRTGTIALEAKNAGSDVIVTIRDDGRGLNKQKLLKKARENGLLHKSEEDMTDKEIFNLIFLPGFSTKESVTEYSGRGVGMDVVTKNIETVGGSVSVDSTADKGTTITIKIPLTLAIIDGMNIKVGNSRFTIPTVSIKESFRPKEEGIITDPDGNEMIMVRGQCYTILRLHELYSVKTDVTDFISGIIIMVEQDDKNLCIFADELLGQQQVVVKSLPDYIKNFRKIRGLAGCTLLGDGSISLILDIAGLAG